MHVISMRLQIHFRTRIYHYIYSNYYFFFLDRSVTLVYKKVKYGSIYVHLCTPGPSLWSWSEFLATDPEARVRFPAYQKTKSSGSGTGFTQPREYNWGATWYKSSGSCLENREYGHRDPSRWQRGTFYPQKLAITLQTSGGRSVGIVRSWTQIMEFFLCTSESSEPLGRYECKDVRAMSSEIDIIYLYIHYMASDASCKIPQYRKLPVCWFKQGVMKTYEIADSASGQLYASHNLPQGKYPSVPTGWQIWCPQAPV
jgi:hypothetical protein